MGKKINKKPVKVVEEEENESDVEDNFVGNFD